PLAPIFMEKEERVLRILDLKTGQTSRLEVENPVDFAFSPNNQWLAVLVGKNKAHLLRWGEAMEAPARSTGPGTIVFSPDSRVFAGVLKTDYWSRAFVDPVPDVSSTFCGPVFVHPQSQLAFTPEGALVFLDYDRTLRAVLVPKGPALWEIPPHGAQHFALHPSGRILATGGPDLNVTLWDVSTRSVVRTLPGLAAGGPLASAAGRVALAAGAEVTVWDPPYERPWFRVAHRGLVTGLAFDARGERLAVLVSGVTAHAVLWDLTRGESLEFVMAAAEATAITLTPEGGMLAAADGHGRVLIWDVAAASLRYTLTMPVRAARVLAFSPDGQKLAAATWVLTQDEPGLVVWDLATGAVAWERRGYGGWVAFRPQGLFAGALGEDLALLDPETGTELRRPKRALRVFNLALDPTGRYLLIIPFEGSVEVWDLEEGRLLGRLPVLGFTHVAGATFGEGGLAFFTSHPHSLYGLGALVAFHLGHLLGR
ncbi:MAG: WD40 repeat domain-containing protein, partial [Candidatus Bipolaricaulaceae bacterium]